MNARTLVLQLSLAAFALLASTAGAQFTVMDPTNLADIPPHSPPPFVHWDLRTFADCEVPYAVNQDGSADLPFAVCEEQIEESFGVWADVAPSLIGFRNVGATATAEVNGNDDENVVFFDDDLRSGDAWDAPLLGGSIALTHLKRDNADGRLIDVDIVFDDDQFVWGVGTMDYHGSLTGADDVKDGTDIKEPDTGGNGVCDSAAIGDDVQEVPVGAAVAAGGVCVSPGTDGVLDSIQNNSGTLDLWSIAAHEVGHFAGFGENNAEPGVGAERLETFFEHLFLAPPGATLELDIITSTTTIPVTAVFPEGVVKPAEAAAAINAAIAGPEAVAVVTPSGSIRITAAAIDTEIIVTGGSMAVSFGWLEVESGMSTMNQTDVRGYTSLDTRTLSRADEDGANFLYSPDMGDAPDPYTAPNLYPSLVHTNTVTGTLNGVNLTAPGAGAEHLYGFRTWQGPRYEYEWLGVNGGLADGHYTECEARVPDMDRYDDGVVITNRFLPGGPPVPVQITVQTAVDVDGGEHDYVSEGDLFVNGWFDWNNDGDWLDADEHPIDSIVVTPLTSPSSQTITVMVTAPLTLVQGGYARFRLDWGENVDAGGAGVDPTLGAFSGAAQSGEAEDYPIPSFLSPWVPFSPGKVGSNDFVPGLWGSGPLTGGSFNQFDLSGGLPFAPSILFFGVSPVLFPVKGGLLGPSPDFQFLLPLDSSGGLSLPFLWPSLPPGLGFYVQSWIFDPDALSGVSASNTISGLSQ
jgi:hypothetical protein